LQVRYTVTLVRRVVHRRGISRRASACTVDVREMKVAAFVSAGHAQFQRARARSARIFGSEFVCERKAVRVPASAGYRVAARLFRLRPEVVSALVPVLASGKQAAFYVGDKG
jgi:hypothetical protein